MEDYFKSADGFAVITNELKKLTNESSNKAKKIREILNGIATSSGKTTVQTGEIEGILDSLESISQVTNLLALNLAIETTRLKDKEEAAKRFALARKSTVIFKEPVVANEFAEKMEELKAKRATGLKEMLVQTVKEITDLYKKDYLETEEKLPVYVEFCFEEISTGGYDYYNDYDYDDEEEETEIIFSEVKLYDENKNRMKNDFYINYQDRYKNIEVVIKNHIQNHVLEHGEAVIIEAEEMKKLVGEDLIEIK